MILVEKFGNQQWILQCMTGVQQCVENSIQMLSGQAVQGNNLGLGRGGQYAFPARTSQELQATQDQAAVGGAVSAASAKQQQFADQSNGKATQAMAEGNVDMFAQLQKSAGLQDPASQQHQAPANEPPSSDWIV